MVKKSNGDLTPPGGDFMKRFERQEEPEDRTKARSVLGITFTNENGLSLGLQYAHYIYAEPGLERDATTRTLTLYFTTHKVTLTGTGLTDPAKDCLMALIQQHKREFVTAIIGGQERDFAQDDGKAKVTSIRWDRIEE